MDDRTMLLPAQGLQAFSAEVFSLSSDQVRRLQRIPRADTTTRLTFELHPDPLAAVSTGRWTRGHDLLALDAHQQARAAAHSLARLGRRGVVTKVFYAAAMVVITDVHPDTALSPALRARLAPWLAAAGSVPGGKGLVSA